MVRSRVTLATIEAAAMEATVASPLTMVSGRAGQVGQVVAVDEGEAGQDGQRGERPRHGPVGGLADVDAVDVVVRHGGDPDGGGGEDQPRTAPRAPGAVSAFESARPSRQSGRIEDHRRRDHRPGERPAPDLVHAGDERRSPRGRGGLRDRQERPGGESRRGSLRAWRESGAARARGSKPRKGRSRRSQGNPPGRAPIGGAVPLDRAAPAL